MSRQRLAAATSLLVAVPFLPSGRAHATVDRAQCSNKKLRFLTGYWHGESL